ncbi:MAG: twin-arginine translocation pathway signal protein [Pseudomonadota bacterium]
MKRATTKLLLVCAVILFAIANPEAKASENAAEIDAKVAAGFKKLYASEPQAADLAKKAVAILMFPDIIKGGLIIGGEYGEGALIQDGKTDGYYSIAAASFGLQAGGQRFGYAMFFLTDAALNYLEESEGFEVGVGPTLVGGDKGWSSSMGTNNLQGDIAVVFFGQEGLMAGAGLRGSKITKIDP